MYNRITMKTRPDICKYAIELSVNGKPVFIVTKDILIVTAKFAFKGSVNYFELDKVVSVMQSYQHKAKKYL